jgi:hypothetical protein
MHGGDTDAESVALLTKYGLGNKRTLDQLIEFTGLDLRNRIAFKDRCGWMNEIHHNRFRFRMIFVMIAARRLILSPSKRMNVSIRSITLSNELLIAIRFIVASAPFVEEDNVWGLEPERVQEPSIPRAVGEIDMSSAGIEINSTSWRFEISL